MLKRTVLFVIALCVAAPVTQASPALTGPWDMITFEMNSWGKPVESWIITTDGSGSWSETKDGASFSEFSIVVHEIVADKAHYEALAAVLKRLPIPAPVTEGCHNFMTDAPYGKIRLTHGATTVELSYNAGCMDPPYAAYLDVLKAAENLVRQWGKDGKVLRTDVHGPAQH